ncbi:MAG TPA: Holliday junction resolvase RuvX [Tenericutes bacterium]|jgi:putative Holliday junction resolvase|nr:Holliday junction resolvase RuvX [Mycoplasmatota bacterium]
MRILGLDLGSKTLGIAISDETETIATPVQTFTFKENDYNIALKKVEELIKKHNINLIVLGYPKNMDNTIGKRAETVQKFKALIEQNFKINVILWDERLSSIQAENILLEHDTSRKKRKKVIDTIAATIILQEYLDYKKNKSGGSYESR